MRRCALGTMSHYARVDVVCLGCVCVCVLCANNKECAAGAQRHEIQQCALFLWNGNALCRRNWDFRNLPRGRGDPTGAERENFALCLSAAGRFLKNQLSKADFPRAANRTAGKYWLFWKASNAAFGGAAPECRLVKCILYKLRARADRSASRERNLRPRRSCFTSEKSEREGEKIKLVPF